MFFKIFFFSSMLLFVLVKPSPTKTAVSYAESRKIQFDTIGQGCQYKPKRDVGKFYEHFHRDVRLVLLHYGCVILFYRYWIVAAALYTFSF